MLEGQIARDGDLSRNEPGRRIETTRPINCHNDRSGNTNRIRVNKTRAPEGQTGLGRRFLVTFCRWRQKVTRRGAKQNVQRLALALEVAPQVNLPVGETGCLKVSTSSWAGEIQYTKNGSSLRGDTINIMPMQTPPPYPSRFSLLSLSRSPFRTRFYRLHPCNRTSCIPAVAPKWGREIRRSSNRRCMLTKINFL